MCYHTNTIAILVVSMYDIRYCITVSPSITTYSPSMPILDETWMWHFQMQDLCWPLFIPPKKRTPVHLDHLLPGPPEMSGRKRRIARRQSSRFDRMMSSQTSGLTSETHRDSTIPAKLDKLSLHRILRNAVPKPNNPSRCLLKPRWKKSKMVQVPNLSLFLKFLKFI